MSAPLWKPSKEALSKSHMAKFINTINKHYSLSILDYKSLHQWSVECPEDFWSSIWNYCNINASQKATQTLKKNQNIKNNQWFVGAALNFAENLLSRRDKHPAIFYTSERGDRETLSYQELYKQVTALASYLKKLGIRPGDRIIGFLPNRPETVIAMLASTSLGAVWSSCSPDFGLQGLLDRFGQIEPVLLFATDGHFYQGKTFSHLEKIQKLQEKIPSLKHTIIVPHLDKSPTISKLKNTTLYNDSLDQEAKTLDFYQTSFDHPLYILYSSGTTGKPKCMVHSVGGTLIQHLKELMLHTDLHPNDKIFFFTTCGWMMWNWLVSSLALGATLVLYEGFPFHPNPEHLFDLIDEAGITVFGVGAKFLEAAEKNKLIPRSTHSLKSLQTILTTGSPLLPKSFDYVYQKIKPTVRLSSISGGSDIISCFALGNPILPVYRGELQCVGLGMDVHIFNEQGKPVIDQKGELVCSTPFPSMPLYFWNDPDGRKYHNAYFSTFPDVWAHGDYAKITKHQGLIIYGRSDTTLNPGGIRIGTAEIYQQIEKIDAIIDGLAVGQAWEGSERIILFVQLREGIQLNNELSETIKSQIKKNTSPHHIPAKIIQVPDIPRTINGKVVELAVKDIIHHQPVKNKEALANPESLTFFEQLDELNS